MVVTEHIVIDWCSGTGSFSEAFQNGDPFRWGIEWKVYEFDINEEFDPDFAVDVLELTAADVREMCDISDGDIVIFLGSPPCKAFSIASVSHHWEDRGDEEPYVPYTEFAEKSLELVTHTFEMVGALSPYAHFIENPRAMGRKVWPAEKEGTFTWCQYRITDGMPMKPSDGWYDMPDTFKSLYCGNGSDCHESAPRGSATGTQGLENEVKRAAVPYGLSSHIRDVIEYELGGRESTVLSALLTVAEQKSAGQKVVS